MKKKIGGRKNTVWEWPENKQSTYDPKKKETEKCRFKSKYECITLNQWLL